MSENRQRFSSPVIPRLGDTVGWVVLLDPSVRLSPRACVTQLQAITWELKSFPSAEDEFQLSYPPGCLSLPLSA